MADPAVSGLNGKLGASYGRFDVTMDDVTTVDGSIAWPLADAWGLQLDGMYAHGTPFAYGFARPEEADYGGFGGHVFWRDPSRAMIGLEGAFVFSGGDETTAYQIGLESEYYLDWLTLGAQAGYSEVDDDRLSAGDDGFYARLSAGCYPVNNLLVNAIFETRYDNISYGLELEYETPVSGLSVFASAIHGEHDNDSVFAGMRYYFGGESNLKSRHRRSDPPSRLNGLFSGIQGFRADLLDQGPRKTPPPSSGATSGSGSIGGSTMVVRNPSNPGSGNLTIGSGNLTIGSGNLTIGSGNLSTGSGNLSTGSGNLTIGSGNLTIGSGNLTIGSGSLNAGGGLTLPPGSESLTTTPPLENSFTGSGTVNTGTLTFNLAALPDRDQFYTVTGSSSVTTTWLPVDPITAVNWLNTFVDTPRFIKGFEWSSIILVPLTVDMSDRPARP